MLHVTFVNGSSLGVSRGLTDNTQHRARSTSGTVNLYPPFKIYHGLHVICQVMWKGAIVAEISHTFFIECKYVMLLFTLYHICTYCLVSTTVYI